MRYTLKAADPYSSHTRIARILDAALAGRRDPYILDVGCAAAMIKRAAELHGLAVAQRAHWVGLDRDLAALAEAAAAGLEVHPVDLALGDLPPLPAPFDAVVIADLLEHLPSPEAALARWLPALCAPATLVVVALPNVANIAVRASLGVGRFEYQERGILDRTHLRFYTRRSARRLLQEAGLVIQRTWVTPVPVHLLGNGWLTGERSVASVQTALFTLTRLAPTLLGYQFVFEARYAHAR